MARPRKKSPGSYHHGELRKALVDATLRIVEGEGTGAVSLSAAARRVGVSPQATYNHFRDKGDLLAAAAEETVRALEQRMRRARSAGGSPGERLEATGVAYVAFARGRAAQFRLLSAPELASKARHPSLLAAYDAAFAVLLEAIEECQRAGVVRRQDSRELAAAAWGMVHGLAWLAVDGQLSVARPGEDGARVTLEALRVLFRGLRSSPVPSRST
jgi:AcrR family transcriptional regulator